MILSGDAAPLPWLGFIQGIEPKSIKDSRRHFDQSQI
jgi:hypothetical protein